MNSSPRKKKLKKGYTTGACATAATRGALMSLLRQRKFPKAVIQLPGGRHVSFPLQTCVYNVKEASASVIKDAGDDPDITHGAQIISTVQWSSQSGIQFLAGEGVGIVTKKGLPVNVGKPAINPVPRAMMVQTIREVLKKSGKRKGVIIKLSVPRGEELAKKTFNPRLGILGGISILGTTGIVIPYSLDAWRASVFQEIDVAAAQGEKTLVFTIGGRGESLAKKILKLKGQYFIQIGEFAGEALQYASKKNFLKIRFAFQIGKLSKFAAGHSSLHSSKSRQDFKFLSETAKEAGALEKVQKEIRQANTAREVSEIAALYGLTTFHSLICKKALTFAEKLIKKKIFIEVLLLSGNSRILAKAKGSNQ